jgi:hypothetical protein
MQRKSIAAKTVLTAVLLAVAIWTTAGSPPHHSEATKRQFAGRP